MHAQSILFRGRVPAGIEECPQPGFFVDLNLDQVVASVTGKDEYTLTPFFYSPLGDVDAVHYRQEVFQDLERPEVREPVSAFESQTLTANFSYRTKEMSREHHGSGHYHRALWFLNAVEKYCQAVTALADGLAQVGVRSRGLRGLGHYLQDYLASAAFTGMQAESLRLKEAIDAVNYCVLVKGDRVTVGHYDDQVDYSEQVTGTFERFQQGAGSDYRDTRPDWQEEDFAELAVLDLVAKLYPELFAALDAFCQQYADYLDATVALVDREFQFYLSFLDYIRPLRGAGLRVSYPRVSVESKDEQVLDTFDLALAAQLIGRGGQVVCNDITLTGPERVLVISGPNNGGKTTLARAVGQLHHFARLGCPVPGRDVRLFLCDQIFTHFEKEEDITTLAGKLQDELNRLHADLALATPASLIVLNEVFNSTTVADAEYLSAKILQRVSELDALGVCVTFLDELSTLNQKMVSMVSQVDPRDPAIRTHKVIRIMADGRAYAHAIADKYGLTYERITAGRRAGRGTS
ncbi:MutS-related protein [Arthrobacter livingstonensis]|uniref:MutS-related protein n=1 Tax=Arthrobacter livingstonensis TaxID=670078 RepID=UPI001B883CDD|nr:hypothetical protein [Arthrobacter livingstonensis]